MSVLILFCLVLLHVCGSSEGLKNITADSGQCVALTCEDPENKKIRHLEWSRDDLDGKVFVFRDGRQFPAAQHESFQNRVILLDSQMKDGDLSVVLENVEIEDSGMYECRVLHESDPDGSPLKLISSIDLWVFSSDLRRIYAEAAQNVILTCEDKNINKVTVLDWIKSDLKENEYVFSNPETNHPYSSVQHESFKNRVFLKDPQMKDGDLSVVLKNVKNEDSGYYWCRVLDENDPDGSPLSLISTIYLSVSPPPPPPGEEAEGGQKRDKEEKNEEKENGDSLSYLGLIALVVPVVAAFVLFWIFKKRNAPHYDSSKGNKQEIKRKTNPKDKNLHQRRRPDPPAVISQ